MTLQAYAISGIKTDHECSSVEDMLARIQLGMYVQIREGSACRDLLELVQGVNAGNARRCLFCTDDREPEDIIEGGHINRNLCMAVEAGLDPILAITMATLNAAECYGLKKKGALAPGYDADVVIVDDLKNFKVRQVFCGGQQVAHDGKLVVDIPDYHCESVLNTMNLAPLTVDDFQLPLTSDKARVIGVLPGGVLTKSLKVSVQVNNEGLFDAQLNPDFNNHRLNKLVVIERHQATGNMAHAILAGYGLKNGAIATTVSHDSHNVVAVGDNDHDMLKAVKRLEGLGGGFVLVHKGEILGELALPVAGLLSNECAEVVAHSMGSLLAKARNVLGVNPEIQPLMTLAFMSLPVIPELKLTSNGLFDVRSFSFTTCSL